MSNLRVKIIQTLIHFNESIFFYPKLKKFYRENLKGKDVSILDVGANKGQSIDFFLGIVPNAKINAFEPNKKLFTLLQEKHKQSPAITIHNVGVSNVNGALEFHENVMDETSTFEELNLDSAYLAKKGKVLGIAKEDIIVKSYKVDVIKLADFLKKDPAVFYDVLKIDVEGHELQCLEGLLIMRLKKCPFALYN
jgi:FkbM family methyltransferase